MPYSDIRLELKQKRKLAIVLLECPCIRSIHSRKIICDELLRIYPTMSIPEFDGLNLLSWVMLLVDCCQIYLGALEIFIESMTEMEPESIPMEQVQITIQEIFFPTSIPISGENLQPPELETPEIIIAETGDLLSTWKKIHTLCEKLVKDYISGVYRYVVGEENSIAKENIRVFHQNCEVFDRNLGRLDPAIFFYWPIRSLKNITPCIGDLLNAMESPPNSTSFIVRKELADSIHKQLFEALSLADRVLQDYFDHLEIT